MFQLKRWNKGIVQRNGRDLRITVSRPVSVYNGILLALIGLAIVYGLLRIILPNLLQVRSLADLLWKASPALIFGLPVFFIFRALFESEFAVQIVSVDVGQLVWARRTKLWTRTKRLNAGDVTGVAASPEWGGFSRVYVTTKHRRYTILDQLLGEDAVRFVRELEQAVGERN